MLYYQDENSWNLTKTLTINHLSGIDGRVRWKTPNLCANIFNVCLIEVILVCISEELMNNWICAPKISLHEKNMYLQFSSNESITLYVLPPNLYFTFTEQSQRKVWKSGRGNQYCNAFWWIMFCSNFSKSLSKFENQKPKWVDQCYQMCTF